MHISYVRKRRFCFHILINVFALVLFARSATSLKCYVCGQGENPNDCDNFNPSNKNLYAKECPPNSQGCSAQTKGHIVINMACEDYKVTDCQIANNIEYCYCSSDLCNENCRAVLCNANTSIKTSITISSVDVNDDEDMIEGSGYNKIFTSNTGSTSSTLQTTVQPPNTGDCLHSTFIVIAASILIP